MKKLITLVVLIFIVILANGQAKFDKGYYIDNQNVKIECLIKNIAWMKTPEEFTYKLSELSEPLTASPSNVKEFGIYDGNRFISAEVMIDVSSDDSQNLSDQRNPIWSKQKMFL
ncbi:MAG TPA: hypothetical protein VLR52_00940, partial [Bacteroidales bacterium]|nr:hypothetical protein [Bacteroidales bacterium]